MSKQIQFHGPYGWAVKADMLDVNPRVLDLVISAKVPVRIVDTATSKVLARSLSARGIPVSKPPKGIIRYATFDPAKDQDPFKPHTSHVLKKVEGEYPRFATT